ncbi:MAG: hypothetical protein PHD97_12325 [Bacteroidales bacterium]|nr:hypothetical protein [Bacteroidales bacterium]
MKTSIKEILLNICIESKKPLAIHEFCISGVNQNNIATRLNELEREGYLLSAYRIIGGKRLSYKEWWYCPVEKERPLTIRDYKTEQLNLSV